MLVFYEYLKIVFRFIGSNEIVSDDFETKCDEI